MPRPSTVDLIAALRAEGLSVHDLRGQMPEHPEKRFKGRDPGALLGMTVHHSATAAGSVAAFSAIAKYHIGPNHVSETGAPGILYTLGIAWDGAVAVFHDLDVRPWSQGYRGRRGDENAEFLSVLAIGNFQSADNPIGGEPSGEQISAVCRVAAVCRRLWGAAFRVTGHYQFGKPACPGATLETVVRALESHTQRPGETAEAVLLIERGIDLSTTLGLQRALELAGYSPGEADGVPGPRTRAALVAFQREADLDADGVLGPATRGALVQALTDHD